MGIKAAYMVPHPPLIVPEVGKGGEKQIIDIAYPERDVTICCITARIDHTPDSDTIHIFDYKGNELASQTL